MEPDFSGKRALVAGAGSGIGRGMHKIIENHLRRIFKSFQYGKHHIDDNLIIEL